MQKFLLHCGNWHCSTWYGSHQWVASVFSRILQPAAAKDSAKCSPVEPASGTGCAKIFVHKVKVSETIPTVCQKLHRLPPKRCEC